MSNRNREATEAEMARAVKAIRATYPDCEPVFGGHGDYGGHRAPRDHTVSCRLRDKQGKFRSNVIWVIPDDLATLAAAQVRDMVDHANGRG